MVTSYTKIKVHKKDGSIEKFDPGKIARVTHAAGLESEDAAILAAKISEWAILKKQPIIKSIQIRKKVIQELKKVDPYAANLFIWYKKNQDPSDKSSSSL